MRRAVVIVASTSAANGRAADTTGPVIVAWLEGRGFEVQAPVVVGDGAPVGAAIRAALASDPAVILTTGGTGVSPTDRTPEETAGVLDTALPGIVEDLRRRGSGEVPAAVLTRGHAGFAGTTFIMNLPGSSGGVRDGLAVLAGVLDHALAQRSGADDERHDARGGHPHDRE